MNKHIIPQWVPISLAMSIFILFSMRECSLKKDVTLASKVTETTRISSSSPSTTTTGTETKVSPSSSTTTETTDSGKKEKEPKVVLTYPEFTGWIPELIKIGNKDYVRYTWNSLKNPESAEMIPCPYSVVILYTNTNTILDGMVTSEGKQVNLKLRYVKNLATNQVTYSKKWENKDWEDFQWTESVDSKTKLPTRISPETQYDLLKNAFEKLRYLPVPKKGDEIVFDLRGYIDVPVTVTRSWLKELKNIFTRN